MKRWIILSFFTGLLIPVIAIAMIEFSNIQGRYFGNGPIYRAYWSGFRAGLKKNMPCDEEALYQEGFSDCMQRFKEKTAP